MMWIELLVFLIYFSALAYQRASLKVWIFTFAIYLALLTCLSHAAFVSLLFAWVIFAVIFFPLFAVAWRQKYITRRILHFYRNSMPVMSMTEREALNAGTVGFEGELFSGNPDWNKLLNLPQPQLSAEEQAFLTGPVEKLCDMIDDWDITHQRADLPPEVWQFLKEEGFFALIIPKEFGGKAFSAFAHSQILNKLAGKSTTLVSTVSVPNSLGPAELLLHYGTAEQKNYYLPRLAAGTEIPCFALTGLEAGSDAGAMTDKGIIEWGEFAGKKIVGIRLNWNKRYITLAPVATLIGLAFKLYDPEHLIGKKKNLGITLALIPRATLGITIGRRHFPCNIVFQNGPIQGKDVFIPLDWIIGGPAMAGQGWRMLMECLAAGRAISLPGNTIGGAKMLAFATGAYAHIRRQFNMPIGRFEGVMEVLARIAGNTYIMDAARTFTVAMIDSGQRPAVASAITKYHVTELGRVVSQDAMDLHGGKGICLGPKNYVARFYQSIPIAITVEGANILTRNMIIFGQGVMRCHPYIFAEFEAASLDNDMLSLQKFDKTLMSHCSFMLSNCVRTFILGLTSARVAVVPSGKMKRYFQQATRFSAVFAILTDASLLVMGGSLKRRENISARLGDILSYLYLLSSVLKHYHDQGKQSEDLPLVRWASFTCLYQIQQKCDELLKNFPNRVLAIFLRFIIFPFGRYFFKPSDKLNQKLAQLLMQPSAVRDRLTAGLSINDTSGNSLAEMADALNKVIAAEPIEKIIKDAAHENSISGDTLIERANSALAKKLISAEQLDILLQAEKARSKIIAVDDFAPEDLVRA